MIKAVCLIMDAGKADHVSEQKGNKFALFWSKRFRKYILAGGIMP